MACPVGLGCRRHHPRQLLHLLALNNIDCSKGLVPQVRNLGRQVCRLGLETTNKSTHLHRKAELSLPQKPVVLWWLRHRCC